MIYGCIYTCIYACFLKNKKNVFNLKHFSKVHAFPHEPFFPKHHVFSKRVMPSFFKNGFQGQVCVYIYVHAYINVNVPKYMYTHDTNAFFRSSPFFFKEMPPFLQKYPCFFKNTSKVLSCFSTKKKKKKHVVMLSKKTCHYAMTSASFWTFIASLGQYLTLNSLSSTTHYISHPAASSLFLSFLSG